jgi:hypothetical protein
MTPLKPKMKSTVQFPHFFGLKLRYGMWIISYEIVLLDIPFKKKLRTHNEDLNIERVHINFSGANDPAEIISAG